MELDRSVSPHYLPDLPEWDIVGTNAQVWPPRIAFSHICNHEPAANCRQDCLIPLAATCTDQRSITQPGQLSGQVSSWVQPKYEWAVDPPSSTCSATTHTHTHMYGDEDEKCDLGPIADRISSFKWVLRIIKGYCYVSTCGGFVWEGRGGVRSLVYVRGVN